MFCAVSAVTTDHPSAFEHLRSAFGSQRRSALAASYCKRSRSYYLNTCSDSATVIWMLRSGAVRFGDHRTSLRSGAVQRPGPGVLDRTPNPKYNGYNRKVCLRKQSRHSHPAVPNWPSSSPPNMSRDSPGQSVPYYVTAPIFLSLFPFLYFIINLQ